MKTITEAEWPNCTEKGCNAKVCTVLESDKCFPHTPGNEHIKRMKIEANRTLGVGTYIE